MSWGVGQFANSFQFPLSGEHPAGWDHQPWGKSNAKEFYKNTHPPRPPTPLGHLWGSAVCVDPALGETEA